MKHTKYLLLLLLLVSCGTRRSALREGQEAEVRPEVTAEVQTPPAEAVVEVPAAEDPASAWRREKRQALDALCQSPFFETTQLGLYVYDLTDEQPLYAAGAAQRMRPASCQKLVTAITALHFLGGDYQLTTDFRLAGEVKAGVLSGNLIVVGGMDPLVTAEELLQAAATIKQQQGIHRIAGGISYDLSMREDAPYGWGWCWDDDYGPLSALLVDGKDCFAQKWVKALEKAGIKATNPSQSSLKGRGVAGSSVCCIRHGIDELLVPMMKNSDNIYAECLFFQTAASTMKKGAGRKEAAERTAELLLSIGLDPDACRVADGSGLSLYNYISAEMLVALLAHAWRREDIRCHLLPSLPVSGYDGTLEKRMRGTEAEGNVRAKTGTVAGISSLAGYLTTREGHTLAFAIINQGVASSAQGRAFQDDVCRELCR